MQNSSPFLVHIEPKYVPGGIEERIEVNHRFMDMRVPNVFSRACQFEKLAI